MVQNRPTTVAEQKWWQTDICSNFLTNLGAITVQKLVCNLQKNRNTASVSMLVSCLVSCYVL